MCNVSFCYNIRAKNGIGYIFLLNLLPFFEIFFRVLSLCDSSYYNFKAKFLKIKVGQWVNISLSYNP